jgi:hypothetical protein
MLTSDVNGDIMVRLAFIILLIILIVAGSQGHANQKSINDAKEMENSATDNANHTPKSIVRSNDGHYFIAGNAYSRANGESYWIWKIKGDGEKVWAKKFKSHYQDKVTAIINTPDGGVLVLGHMFVYEPEIGYRCWIKRIDTNGETSFTKTIDGFGWADILLRTTDGNYLIAGTTNRKGNKGDDNRDAWIVKLNPIGNIIWSKFYDKGSDEAVFSGVNVENDGFLFSATSGKQNKFGQGPSEGWIVKYDSAGVLLAEAKLADCRSISSGAYIATKAAEFAVICSTSQLPPIDKVPLMFPSFGARITGFDYKLKELWGLNRAGYSSIMTPMIATSTDGHYIIAGVVEKGIKIDRLGPDGKLVWERTAEYIQKGHFSSNVEDIIIDNNIAFILGNLSELEINGQEQVFLLKIDTMTGNILLHKTY